MHRAKLNPQISLKPQDLVTLLRLVLTPGAVPTFATLAEELGLTASEIHAGVERATLARLVRRDASGKAVVARDALTMFILHGACYAFPAIRGEATRGVPTSYAAPPLRDKVLQPSEMPPVWPYKNGTVRGMAFYPLYPSVPAASARNVALYELLVLFDAIRGGSPRERALAQDMLASRLQASHGA